MINTRKFKFPRDPYDAGFHISKKATIEIESGFTVMIGCNGTGKTTILSEIKERLEDEKIPLVYFDNLSEGGSKEVSHLLFSEDYTTMAGMLTSSEGENIKLNISLIASALQKFIDTGKYKKYGKSLDWSFMLPEEERKKANAPSESNERWILLDAVDSGFSIDNVVEFKDFIHLILEDAERKGKEVFIVATANSFELARDEKCFDVYNGKYIPTFTKYEDYKKFILKSRVQKDKRFPEE